MTILSAARKPVHWVFSQLNDSGRPCAGLEHSNTRVMGDGARSPLSLKDS
ncbi:MAG TPA: hypothetical protein VKU19_25775 [Bryobacteraceae bacterium]|nr:hypothetical protein [Bryobacteraceae bacterium]